MTLRDKVGQEMKELNQNPDAYPKERRLNGYVTTNACTYGGNPAERK